MRLAHGRRVGLLALVAIGVAVLAAGCAGSTGRQVGDATPSSQSSSPELVADLSSLPEATVARYRFIAANQDLAERMPCYCGCGESQGHRSLKDCFITDAGAYDAHAGGCAVCLGETQEIEMFLAQGLAVSTIRARIEQRWSTIGPPTETP